MTKVWHGVVVGIACTIVLFSFVVWLGSPGAPRVPTQRATENPPSRTVGANESKVNKGGLGSRVHVGKLIGSTGGEKWEFYYEEGTTDGNARIFKREDSPLTLYAIGNDPLDLYQIRLLLAMPADEDQVKFFTIAVFEIRHLVDFDMPMTIGATTETEKVTATLAVEKGDWRLADDDARFLVLTITSKCSEKNE